MDSKTIQPAPHVGGTLEVPGDKSISHRAVILSALSVQPTQIHNFLRAEDCLATIEAFRQMGILIRDSGQLVEVQGKGLEGLSAPKQALDCGNSGTTTRLMMGVLTGQNFDVELRGDASLSRRPMGRVIEPLSKMGATFTHLKKAGCLPLKMRGSKVVHPISWKSPVASAQVKSAILLAGLYASGKSDVLEPALSRDHTERMLKSCGVDVSQRGFHVEIRGRATLRASEFHIPGDLSSAAFLWAAAVLCSPSGITVRRVGINPTRMGFLELIKAMGVNCQMAALTEASGEPVADVTVKKSLMKAISVGGDLIPRSIDEIPILTVLATQAMGQTVIRDAAELRVKESDRLAVLREELSKMGARIEEQPDGLIIQGSTALKGAVVRSHGDHRLAMSLAVAALVAQGPTTIQDIACVNTSFPSFWDLLEQIRGR